MAHIAILTDVSQRVDLMKASAHGNILKMKALRELGHRVTFVTLWNPKIKAEDVQAELQTDDIRRIEPTKEESKAFCVGAPFIIKHCPAGAVRTLVSVKPDAAIIMGIDSILIMRGKLQCPTIGQMSIPEWKLIPWRIRSILANSDLGLQTRYQNVRDHIRCYFRNRRSFRELGGAVDIALTPDPNTIELFNFVGRSGCKFFPAPVVDLVGAGGWARKREQTIIMVNAQGTHSDAAHLFFSRNIVPALEAAGNLGFRLEITGRNELPPFVRLPKSVAAYTEIRPYETAIDERLRNAIALLMCSPIPIGSSHRVKNAMMPQNVVHMGPDDLVRYARRDIRLGLVTDHVLAGQISKAGVV